MGSSNTVHPFFDDHARDFDAAQKDPGTAAGQMTCMPGPRPCMAVLNPRARNFYYDQDDYLSAESGRSANTHENLRVRADVSRVLHGDAGYPDRCVIAQGYRRRTIRKPG